MVEDRRFHVGLALAIVSLALPLTPIPPQWAWPLTIMLWATAAFALGRAYLPSVSAASHGGSGTMKKNSVEVGGTNNVVTVGHIGDVTINEAPAPELRLGTPTAIANGEGTQTIRIPAEVVSPYPPGSLRVEAWAPEILGIDIAAQRSGLSFVGHSGIRSDHAFNTVIQPFGRYVIEVRTRKPTDIEIRYDFDV